MAPPQAMPPRPPQQVDPATQAAVRGAIRGLPMPGAYGQLAQRAALSPLFGPGGPPLPGGAPPQLWAIVQQAAVYSIPVPCGQGRRSWPKLRRPA